MLYLVKPNTALEQGCILPFGCPIKIKVAAPRGSLLPHHCQGSLRTGNERQDWQLHSPHTFLLHWGWKPAVLEDSQGN